MPVGDYIVQLLQAGWMGLLDYLAAHVLLCLVPAFFIAGYLSGLMPKGVITRYLGPRTPKYISYPAAAAGGFLLAVCSCTILPLFAGIWKRGAGLGPAITFLFVGPAVNILAISYTGAAIGMDIALARIVLSIAFGILIGLIMAALFKQPQAAPVSSDLFQDDTAMRPALWVFFVLLLAVLVAGTLQIDLLTGTLFTVRLPVDVPVQPALDALNLTFQGALLIVLLVIIAPVAWKGLNDVLNGFNRWTWASLALVALTLLLAAPATESGSIVIHFTGRFVAEALLLAAIVYVAARHLERDELAGWLAETWRFVKQIFPLLIVGVFAAGVVRALIPEDWIRTLAGQNTIGANLLAVTFGVFMYFPTLVEVPIARMFLDLGMNRGPLLAYLLSDPELSLQSILVTGKILGRRKTAAYVGLVAVFSTLAGYLFGLFLAQV
ncbi:MAG: permease [Chloroflexi bacterium]|nr:permease [Chloroflexota bacterium]MDL1885398.1 permease [Anaerolineae bacterium CFX8]